MCESGEPRDLDQGAAAGASEDALAEPIGKRVARLRKLRGISQVELARRSGIAAQRMRRLELGQTVMPPSELLEQLAPSLGVSLDYLTGGDRATAAAREQTHLSAFGERVKALRTTRGWTQSDLALRAGVSIGWLGQVERGLWVRPSAWNLSAVASSLGVTVDELLGESETATTADLPPELQSLIERLADLGRQLADTPEGRAVVKKTVGVAIALLESMIHEQAQKSDG